MAITLAPTGGGPPLALPDGLVWEDEFAWTPIVQALSWSLTGALLVETAEKRAGRPITLVGGKQWAWVSRETLASFRASLATTGAQFTLTLHDGRSGLVVPMQDGNGPLTASQVPWVSDSGVADPGPATKYHLDTLRLLSLGTGDF